jgi:hypothetical protein
LEKFVLLEKIVARNDISVFQCCPERKRRKTPIESQPPRQKKSANGKMKGQNEALLLLFVMVIVPLEFVPPKKKKSRQPSILTSI